MSALLKRLAARWQLLQPRERRLARWCGLIVLAASLVTAEDWLRRERLRLQTAIPAAEARLALMQQMADEWNGAAESRAGAHAPVALIADSLQTRGLSLTVVVTGSSQVALSGAVSFDEWVDWLAFVAAQGWRLERATVRREAASQGEQAPRAVTIEATLGAVAR